MLYPCFRCPEKVTCKKDCEKKADYIQFRKENVKKNRQWAKESSLVKKK